MFVEFFLICTNSRVMFSSSIVLISRVLSSSNSKIDVFRVANVRWVFVLRMCSGVSRVICNVVVRGSAISALAGGTMVLSRVSSVAVIMRNRLWRGGC